jgi:ABC-type polysaccharide/polyol phosphate export permease
VTTLTRLTVIENKPVYGSAHRIFLPLLEVKEAWRYCDLILFLVRRDATANNKRSVLDIAWTMLNPLGMMIVLSIVFSQIFCATTDGYAAYVLSGLIAWSFLPRPVQTPSTCWCGEATCCSGFMCPVRRIARNRAEF